MLLKFILIAIVLVLAASILYDVIKNHLARRGGQRPPQSAKDEPESLSGSGDKPGKNGE